MPQAQSALETFTPTALLLDPQNPRLSAHEEGSDQDQLRKIMVERFKLEELADSIAASGYLPFDPIIGCRRDGQVIILEGNRRVAALQLLLSPELAPIKYKGRWESLNASLNTAVRESIESIDVQVFDSREDADVRAYIGFRHVTGVLQWPALEKASFISELIDAGWEYEAIANRLGSYPKHVERHYVGFRIVQQARSLDLPGANRLESSFGVLMRALQSPQIREFLGIDFPGDPECSKQPIFDEKLENFGRFVLWTFGSNDQPRLLKDSRQLTQWGKILASPESVSYLRRTPNPSFERAWFKSGGETESLVDSLLLAADSLEESIPLIPLHKAEPEVKRAVERCALFLSQALRDYPDIMRVLCGEPGSTE